MAARPLDGRPGREDSFSIQHGLYWLVAELAEARPLLIAGRRRPVGGPRHPAALTLHRRGAWRACRSALVVTVRVGECGAWTEACSTSSGASPARADHPPTPLSEAAARRSPRRPAGARPRSSPRPATEATGGNPFLLVELLPGARPRRGLEPSEENAERLERLAAAGASRAILARLARLGEDEIEIARAVAILEPRAEVRARRRG